MRFLKENMPGYEHAQIEAVAPQLGVRETRRITSLHRMTFKEAEEGYEYPDLIGRWNFWHRHIMGISYRSMIPAELDGVIVAGRPVDSDSQLAGCLRLIGPALVMGHAAGVAAAICVKDGVHYRDVDVKKLQETLREQGAYLDRYEPTKRDTVVNEDLRDVL
jgi:hypothetical protein